MSEIITATLPLYEYNRLLEKEKLADGILNDSKTLVYQYSHDREYGGYIKYIGTEEALQRLKDFIESKRKYVEELDAREKAKNKSTRVFDDTALLIQKNKTIEEKDKIITSLKDEIFILKQTALKKEKSAEVSKSKKRSIWQRIFDI